MTTGPADFRLPGAVDLGALRSRPPAGDGPATGSPHVVDVTEATFQAEVLERSQQVPVVIDFWAEWCGPCKQLSPVLEKLAAEGNGSWVLAKIDVDANQRIAAAAQVQSIPTIMAVIGGQIMPLFMGAMPEAQVRQAIAEVLRVAGEVLGAGAAPDMSGDADPGGVEAAAPPVGDPRFADAEAALGRGDLEAAAAAYRAVLDQQPSDQVARSQLAKVDLLVRTRGADESAARRRAAESPDDVDAQIAVADLDLLRGAVDDAFGRLIDVVRRSSGEERERVRVHLLELFDVLPGDDPRVGVARRGLASALF